MITANEARYIIDQSGVQIRKIAQRTNIIYIYLSEFLNNKRILTHEEMVRLENYLEKVKTIIT